MMPSRGGYRPIDVELMKGSSGSDYWQTEELSELLWYGQGTGGTNR